MDAHPVPDPGYKTTLPTRLARSRSTLTLTRPALLKGVFIAALGLLALLILYAAVSGARSAGSEIFHTQAYALVPSQQVATTDAALTPAAAAAPTTASAAAAAGGSAPADWDHKILRNGQIDLMVADVENSIAAVRDIAVQANGFVAGSNSQYQGDTLVAAITLQVPADTFDRTMTSLRKLGVKVLSEASSSQDVTEEYTDLGSQLKNLQAQEEQLRLLMSKATTVDETLTVQRELGQVRGEIEKIQGRMNYIDRRAALSTITVNLSPKPVAAAPPPATTPTGWRPEATAARAWDASLALLSNLGDVIISVAVFSWWIVPVLFVGALLLRRRSGVARAS